MDDQAKPISKPTNQSSQMTSHANSSFKPLRIALVGAGTRGAHLARQLAGFGQAARMVAVAEPHPERRAKLSRELVLQDLSAFASWEELLQSSLECDAAIIATLDHQHTAPAVAFLRRGCHLLLEKPMSDTFAGCLEIVKAQEDSGRILSVCHTLRYSDPFQRVQEIVVSGRLGQILHLEQMEAIGHFRFAHNYVRGRWAREKENTSLLLHKCCHDLDFISWVIGHPCRRVSSFGSLCFFQPGQAPAGSGKRCLEDCPISHDCLYSAVRLYVETDLTAWPARDVCSTHTREAHLEAVRSGRWGACVWHAGNDVVDHQSVLMEFEGGTTATCTLSGYSSTNGRRCRVQGTRGELLYDEAASRIMVREFSSTETEWIELGRPSEYHPEDREILKNWLSAIHDPANRSVMVDAQEALRTHAIVFAAEQSRKEKRMVELSDYYNQFPR